MFTVALRLLGGRNDLPFDAYFFECRVAVPVEGAGVGTQASETRRAVVVHERFDEL